MARLARPPAILKKWEEYLPQHPRFASSRVLPAVRRGALEIEAIARLKDVAFSLVQTNFEFAAEHGKAAMRVGSGWAVC